MRTNLFRLLILVFICLAPLAACNQAEEGVAETAAQVVEEDGEKTTDEGEGGEGQDTEDEDAEDEDAADEDAEDEEEVDTEGEGYDETGTGDDQ